MKPVNATYSNNKTVLSSLVINLPSQVKPSSSTNKFSSALARLFGINLELTSLLALFTKTILNTAIIMAVTCISFFCVYIPLQIENNNLLNTTEKLSNKQYILSVKTQEASTYKRLFNLVKAYTLVEPIEIVRTKQNEEIKFNKNTKLNTYSRFYYSGF